MLVESSLSIRKFASDSTQDQTMNVFKCIILTLYFALVIRISYVEAVFRNDPLVETRLGLIRGLRSADGEYSMFLGVPYATVNYSNPFGASTPYPKFDEIFEAFDDSAMCPQVEEFNNTIVGNLDCLHLNIYVPSSASKINQLPVLVWIYGGVFSYGYSRMNLYGPNYLVRHEVILVTFNYRLGPYGFMCLDIPEIPGNQGLKDQELALKWIKENVDSFGGDSERITIFGQSAGGVSVDLHLYFNKQNHFSQVILQSGSAVGPLALVDSDSSTPLKLANYLGFSTENLTEALAFLAAAETDLVIEATTKLDIVFKPCVEKSFDGVKSFITEYPINLNIKKVKDIPVLIGNNNDEIVFSVLFWNEETINLFLEILMKYFNFDPDTLADMKNLVKLFYIGDEQMNVYTAWHVSDFLSDLSYCYPTQRSIQKYIKNNAKVVYQYMFAYNGGRNFVKSRLNMSEGGAAHADEVGYLFDVSFMKDEPSPEDQLIIDRITTLWTNFAKYGNPTPEVTDLLPVMWNPVTEDTFYYLNIDSEMTLKRRPFHERMAFWDLFYKLNNKNEIGYREL